MKNKTKTYQSSNFIQDIINECSTNGIMTTCKVVGSILFTADHLIGVKQVLVYSCTDFV